MSDNRGLVGPEGERAESFALRHQRWLGILPLEDQVGGGVVCPDLFSDSGECGVLGIEIADQVAGLDVPERVAHVASLQRDAIACHAGQKCARRRVEVPVMLVAELVVAKDVAVRRDIEDSDVLV